MSDLIAKLDELEKSSAPEFEKIASLDDLQQLKVKILGKKGALNEVLKNLKNVDAKERPKVGQAANALRARFEERFLKSQNIFADQEIERKLKSESIDISLPGKKRVVGAKHPIVQVIDRLTDIFEKIGFSQMAGPEVETDFCNFEALNVPKDHPARDMQDTFYVSPATVLRTHTSPVQIRTMLQNKPPLKIIVAGCVFRNEEVDATHSPMFHQIEGLYIDSQVTMEELKGTLEYFAKELFGQKTKIRLRPSFFPFTEPSVEVDISCVFCQGKGCRICKQSGWVEMLGAGMVHPRLYEHVEYSSSEKYRGFAFGLGVERIAMFLFGINDIRLFYENDLRFLEQFR